MVIAGMQKLTLLDFPGYTACTLFTPGCNFRCPFCHNAGLVRTAKNQGDYSEEEIIDYLKTRKGKLDGVCITGGEPLLHGDIIEFIKKIKELGFLVKVDTNGSRYDLLREIVGNRLCDYVAMDVKNTPSKYHISVGENVDVEVIKKSVELLKEGEVDYEFRTTVVKELNAIEDFSQIAKWLKGAKAYYLQQFKDSGAILMPGYSAYSNEDMYKILETVKSSGMENVHLRGVE